MKWLNGAFAGTKVEGVTSSYGVKVKLLNFEAGAEGKVSGGKEITPNGISDCGDAKAEIYARWGSYKASTDGGLTGNYNGGSMGKDLTVSISGTASIPVMPYPGISATLQFDPTYLWKFGPVE